MAVLPQMRPGFLTMRNAAQGPQWLHSKQSEPSARSGITHAQRSPPHSGDQPGILAVREKTTSAHDHSAPTNISRQPALDRELTLPGAVALNMLDMIGVGPFITLPLMVVAMGGPQAMLGWLLGAGLAMCDGLVWAELGAAMPQAGGSYEFLRMIYSGKSERASKGGGRGGPGRMVAFLFIWQLTFSAPLSIASGCIGLSQYAGYLEPSLRQVLYTRELSAHLPLLGGFTSRLSLGAGSAVAIAACLLAMLLLYRNIRSIGRLSELLWVGVMGTIAWILFAGFTHFHANLAFDFPAGAFHPSKEFFLGLGSAMLIASYDYWGYYNICFLGGEVKNPGRNIPRAVLISIAVVAALYLLMNISVLGVLPWRELAGSSASTARLSVIALFFQRIYGPAAGKIAAVLVMWTAFASIFSLMLGYSRVPYAAARDGNYFRVFGRLHPTKHFPHISLLVMGSVAALFCLLDLKQVIAALVVIRIVLQFLLQHIGVMWLRRAQPHLHRPFRIWLYPWPPLLAAVGFAYILFSRADFQRELSYAAAIILSGCAIYLLRSWRRREWPFRGRTVGI
ncbi:MAG: APC family permease [Acidobacteriaceae bacterium]